MFWTFFFATIPFLVVILLKSKKALHMLQQNWYNYGNRYIDWILKNPKKVFVGLDVFYILFFFGKLIDTEILLFLFFAFSLMVVVTTYQHIREEQVKKPLVVTKRVKRLIYTTILLYGIIYLLIGIFFKRTNLYLYFALLGILGYFHYFVIWLVNIINKPIEKYVFYYYKRKAILKLRNMSDMSVIGITGSYGKTSSKNILADILNVKYNAFPTPKNFNTTYGMINTINIILLLKWEHLKQVRSKKFAIWFILNMEF